jgi:3-hydroxymyristoyl/3-hydroxydecanoyl-(acyl carrier protein) dehydratase
MTAPFVGAVVEARRVHARLPRAYLTTLCEGHFPHDPIVPGAYVAGLMAELAALLPAIRDAKRTLAAVERCTFLAPLRPADDVVVAATTPAGSTEGITIDADVHAGTVCVARGRLRFA